MKSLLLLSLLLWPLSAVAAPQAAPQAALQSVPRDYALLSRSVDGREAPTMVLRVDSVIYPARTSYKQFLVSGAPRTPEQLYARYTDLLLAPRADDAAFLELFPPERKRTQEDRKKLLDTYASLRRYAPQIGAPTWRRRYDFGNSSILDVKYPTLEKPQKKELFRALIDLTFTGLNVKRTPNRAYFGKLEFSNIAFALVNHVYGREEPLPTKQTLPYSFVVSEDQPKAATKENSHRVTVLFDGTVLDVPLNGTTQTADAAVNFVQGAAQIHRADKISDILRLWDKESAKDIRDALNKNYEHSSNEEAKALFSDSSLRVVFVINFDQGALVVLRRPKPSKDQSTLEFVPVSKQDGAYKLSFQSNGVVGTANLDKLLQSPDFQRYLLRIIDQPTA